MSRTARFKYFLFACAGAFAPISAPALQSFSPKLKDHEIRLGLAGNLYLAKPNTPNSDVGTGNVGLTVGVRGVGRKDYFHFAVEGESFYGLRRSNYRYLDIEELYLGFEKKEAANRPFVYLGRKRFQWSDLDSYWSLGLFQPRFRWDYLNERESGLFGLFFGWNSEYMQFHGYFSPVSIPEQGAPFDISSGSCHSSSPWFSCPASTVTVFGQATPVHMTLDIPPLREILMHNGGGASLRLGRYKGPFARASWAHKPMAQLLLAFDGRFNLANNNVPATIRPRVLYHDLFSLDVGVQDTRHGITLSAIQEKPHRDYTPPNWNTQEVTNATILGGTLRVHPIPQLRNTRTELSYQHRKGGNAPDRGPFVTPGIDFFEPRYNFQNAFSFALFSPFSDDWASRFLMSTRFVVDTANDGNLLVVDFHFYPWPSFMLNAGLDLLGSNATSPVDFLSRYQRNDRVRGGISYAF